MFHFHEFVCFQSGRIKRQVCAKFFSSVFKIGHRRMISISKAKLEGKTVKDNRGEDHMTKKFGSKRESIRRFIFTLRVSENHYGRQKKRRVYQPSAVNIKNY